MSLSELGKKDAEATTLAFRDPQPGDRFTEMYAFWLYVIGRDGERVATLEANPPCTLPDDGELRWQSLAEFGERFAYGTVPGYWIHFVDSGNNVAGWLEAKDTKELCEVGGCAEEVYGEISGSKFCKKHYDTVAR